MDTFDMLIEDVVTSLLCCLRSRETAVCLTLTVEDDVAWVLLQYVNKCPVIKYRHWKYRESRHLNSARIVTQVYTVRFYNARDVIIIDNFIHH